MKQKVATLNKIVPSSPHDRSNLHFPPDENSTRLWLLSLGLGKECVA